MVAKLIARGIRAALDEMGYVLWKKEFLQYGISVYDDIARLNRAWGRSVNTFFDVGANVGQTAREALRRFPSARVYAFEPHPASFLKLVAIKDDRLSAHQIALSERSGKATLYQYGEAGDGSLINSLVKNARFPIQFGHQPKKEVNVTCSTVDDFCFEHGIDNIDVLKLDTEGSELAVLKGAERMLASGRCSYVYTEFNELQSQPGMTGGALIPISDLLSRRGLRYVATYTDFVLPNGGMHVCANALFALPSTRSLEQL
ncbi:MAG TPA: FkbM family methyltransferase [Xanthobacteraceae bacterium]|jgi:FkbM family methyltransferase|nr:FkbM family methyltransferase [Xanthobacteraceae bacterium]